MLGARIRVIGMLLPQRHHAHTRALCEARGLGKSTAGPATLDAGVAVIGKVHHCLRRGSGLIGETFKVANVRRWNLGAEVWPWHF